jgi:predicted nucleic acid-binding protein
MKLRYLVDTDWVIDHLNNIQATTEKLLELEPKGVALSVMSLAELYEGVFYSRDPEKNETILDMFLSRFPVMEVDQDICQCFGRERGKL